MTKHVAPDEPKEPLTHDGARITFMRRMLQVRDELRAKAEVGSRSPDYRKAMREAAKLLEAGLQDMGLVLR